MKSPYLNVAEACEHLRFVDHQTGALLKDALLHYIDRHNRKHPDAKIRTFRRGGAVLIAREDLDASLAARRAS